MEDVGEDVVSSYSAAFMRRRHNSAPRFDPGMRTGSFDGTGALSNSFPATPSARRPGIATGSKQNVKAGSDLDSINDIDERGDVHSRINDENTRVSIQNGVSNNGSRKLQLIRRQKRDPIASGNITSAASTNAKSSRRQTQPRGGIGAGSKSSNLEGRIGPEHIKTSELGGSRRLSVASAGAPMRSVYPSPTKKHQSAAHQHGELASRPTSAFQRNVVSRNRPISPPPPPPPPLPHHDVDHRNSTIRNLSSKNHNMEGRRRPATTSSFRAQRMHGPSYGEVRPVSSAGLQRRVQATRPRSASASHAVPTPLSAQANPSFALGSKQLDLQQPHSTIQTSPMARMATASSAASVQSNLGVGNNYARNIASRASEHRQVTRERGEGVLSKRIRDLEENLRKHRENEHKLQDVNRRLQERLVLFQRQNAENVRIAKERITELQMQVHQAQHSIQDQAMLSSPTSQSSPNYRKLSPQANLDESEDTAWVERLRAARQIFRQRCCIKRRRELAIRVFRAWAGAVILRKICDCARFRKSQMLARKCFASWASATVLEQNERQQRAQARSFHLDKLRLRRCFQAWSYAASCRRQRRVMVEGRLCWRSFQAWRELVQNIRERRLRNFFQKWVLVYMRSLRSRLRAYAVRDAVSHLTHTPQANMYYGLSDNEY